MAGIPAGRGLNDAYAVKHFERDSAGILCPAQREEGKKLETESAATSSVKISPAVPDDTSSDTSSSDDEQEDDLSAPASPKHPQIADPSAVHLPIPTLIGPAAVTTSPDTATIVERQIEQPHDVDIVRLLREIQEEAPQNKVQRQETEREILKCLALDTGLSRQQQFSFNNEDGYEIYESDDSFSDGDIV